jgi:spermidine synthase
MQVEIDQLVMDLCAKYFPGIRATYADPRATVVVKDIRHFLAEQMASPSPMLFDLIIIDSTDIDLSIGLAQTLGSYKRLLKPRGILICEVDTGGPQKLQGFADDFEIFKDKFEYTNFFVSHGTAWVSGSIVFAFCSDAIHPMRESVNWAAFQAKRMPLQYYNPAVHYSSFALPSVYLRAVKQTLNDIAPKWFFEPDDDEEGGSGSEGPGVVGLSQYLV